ncbi:MAG: HIT domain-containing protein [Magnetospirillum sp. WYHS-4]
MFDLHPTLAEDTEEVARLAVCRVLLMKDANYPWLILVPQREGLKELHDLGPDLGGAMEEVALASRLLAERFRPAKINVAALGNIVSQLHVHVVARFADDPAWPRPVWGAVPRREYAPAEWRLTLEGMRAAFGRTG